MASFWAAAIVVARSFLIDWLRTLAFVDAGQTAFGSKTMMRSRWAKALVSSRFSRALYGFTKAVVFVYLGAVLLIQSGQAEYGWSIGVSTELLMLIGQAIVWLTVVMCLVRGVPVIWDSQDVLFRKMFPGLLRD